MASNNKQRIVPFRARRCAEQEVTYAAEHSLSPYYDRLVHAERGLFAERVPGQCLLAASGRCTCQDADGSRWLWDDAWVREIDFLAQIAAVSGGAGQARQQCVASRESKEISWHFTQEKLFSTRTEVEDEMARRT